MLQLLPLTKFFHQSLNPPWQYFITEKLGCTKYQSLFRQLIWITSKFSIMHDSTRKLSFMMSIHDDISYHMTQITTFSVEFALCMMKLVSSSVSKISTKAWNLETPSWEMWLHPSGTDDGHISLNQCAHRNQSDCEHKDHNPRFGTKFDLKHIPHFVSSQLTPFHNAFFHVVVLFGWISHY